jgi:heme/copper-type cytochrome/quinol oxidase subunit 3
LGLIAEYFATPARRRTGYYSLANLILFSLLLALMFYMRWVSEAWPTPFHFPSLLMAGAMSMFSVCASMTMAIGASAAKLEDKEPAIRWIAIAITSWLVFLFLEIVEWVRLVYLEQLGPDTSFGWTFIMLTGTHWLAAARCLCSCDLLDISECLVVGAGGYSVSDKCGLAGVVGISTPL